MARKSSEVYLISKKLDFAFPSKMDSAPSLPKTANMLMDRRKFASLPTTISLIKIQITIRTTIEIATDSIIERIIENITEITTGTIEN